MVLGELDSQHKDETGPLSYTVHKTNSQWTEDLNTKPDRETPGWQNGEKHLDIGLGDGVYASTSKAKAMKAKQTSGTVSTIESFCAAKKTIHKVKRQPVERERVFANHVCDKRLISKL